MTPADEAGRPGVPAVSPTSISVVTLAGGRPDHLVNLVIGLSRQTVLPDELIVAVIQGEPYALPAAPFPVRQLMIAAGSGLPLAAARNAAARAATGDLLVFLDMDCIPAPSFVADYAARAAAFDGVLMGEVLYLPAGATAGDWTCDGFAAVAVKHSDRQGPPVEAIERCGDYRHFWSLNFAVPRAAFEAVGGFDERYVGYGGEDTDFAKACDVAGRPIAWVQGALAFHQYHPHHMPPVHHLDSVVGNAELFEAKWGYRTMGHWLHAFALMGLIDAPRGGRIRILRRPDEDDLALTRQQAHQPYANTASVIRLLEQRGVAPTVSATATA